jgi:hypothetical protein
MLKTHKMKVEIILKAAAQVQNDPPKWERTIIPTEEPKLWYIISGKWRLDCSIKEQKVNGTKSEHKITLSGEYGLGNENKLVIIKCNFGQQTFKKLFDGYVIIFNREDPNHNLRDQKENVLPTNDQQKEFIKYLNEFVSGREPIGTIRP